MSVYDRIVDDFSELVNSTFESAALHLRKVPGSDILTRYISSSYQNDPLRSLFELLLFVFAIRYFLASKYSTTKQNYVELREDEIDQLVNEWEPEPIVEPLHEDDQWQLDAFSVIDGVPGPIVKLANDDVVGKAYLNFASTDSYNTIENVALQQRANKVIRKYGVGSCGPAGFYGNQEAHILAEKDLARFLRTEGAILYSQGLATASSVIPCFLKRGDVAVVDKRLNVSILKGVSMSRATIVWYDHLSMKSLEEALAKARAAHKSGPLPRRFIITESIYEYDGQSPDLANVVRLAKEYKFRIMLDESLALLNLGKTGRGLIEESGVQPKDIEIIIGSLAFSFGGAGGFCAGSSMMVESQRITSLAYTFSATMPAYLADKSSAMVELALEGAVPIASLQRKIALARRELAKNDNIKLVSREGSSTILITPSRETDERTVQKIVDECRSQGLLISRQISLEQHLLLPLESYNIRVTMNDAFTDDQILKATDIIRQSFNSVLL